MAGRPYHAVVLIMGFTAVSRWRLPILIAGLLLAVGLGVLGESSDAAIWGPAFGGSFGVALAWMALSLLATYRYHPAVLLARPRVPAFAPRPSPAWVFTSLFLLQLGGFSLADNVQDVRNGEELWALTVAPTGLWIALMIFHGYLSWRGTGVELRPDGVYDRQPLGSLFVPWDALVRAYPAVAENAQHVALYYERPGLIRRRGLRPGPNLPAVGVDAGFLARAIGEYVAHPEHRAAIGTEAELRRLSAAIAG